MAESLSLQRNVLGELLESCCKDPVTGFFRDGYCHTQFHDVGGHTICVKITEEFLQFSLSKGNDLVTPNNQFGFPGLKPDNQWCICAQRWKEAFKADKAPPVHLRSTNAKALEVVSLDILKQFAIDIN